MNDLESSNSEILRHVIGELGMVVLQVDFSGENDDSAPILKLVETNPPVWFDLCFGPAENVCQHSAFLDDFIHGQARTHWENIAGSAAEPLRSGMWEETADNGDAHYFQAQALLSGSAKILLIECVDQQHEVEIKWAQYAHDKALQQRRLAKEQEKKEILLDCIIHDLSSPLATILMNVQHVRRQVERDDLRLALDRAMTQAQRQRKLIRSITDVFAGDLSAFQSVHLDDGETADIVTVAEEMVDALELPAHQKEVHLTLSIETQTPDWRVIGDREHLARVFDNIISNAIRHSPTGGTVEIRLSTHDQHIHCTIIDDGPGVSETLMETIFQPFSQGNDSVGKSGLGLYFCRMVLELWGGSIGCEPREKAGTRFWFKLPLASKLNPGNGK